METKGKFIMIISNHTLFSDNKFTPNDAAFKRLADVVVGLKKLLLITKIKSDKEQQKVLSILKERLPTVPTHHFLFCEQVESIYSLVR